MRIPKLRSRPALIVVAVVAALGLFLGYLVLDRESGVDANKCQAAVAYFEALEGLREANIAKGDNILADEWVDSIQQMTRECKD